MALVTRQFHIEDRARGRIVATGEIDASDLVIWDETETSVREELSDLAEQIQRDIAAGYTLMAHGLDLASAEWFRSCFIMTRRGVCMADARLSRQVSAGFHGPGRRFDSVEQVLGGSLAGSGQRLDAG
ncbi:hypothetical protein EEB14_50105, partial [Rhodococcus sp. WS4]